MADLFELTGSVTLSTGGSPSLELLPAGAIDESLQLTERSNNKWTLASASSLSIDFGPITNAHVVVAKIIGTEITLEITTDEGTDQVVPVDSVLIMISQTSPVTAIKATGTAELHLFLGEI